MALVLKDRVLETSQTSGTGTIALSGAVNGFQTFSSAIGNTNTTYYAIIDDADNQWEVGLGTVGAGTLTRDTVYSSSNGGSKVNFGTSIKNVFCDYPASKSVYTDTTGSIADATLTSPKINQINDTNGNEILGLSPTTSATDYLVVKNGIGVGVPLHVYADGTSANTGLHIQPKGTGLVTISDGTDFNKGIRFRSSSSAASAITLLDAVSSAGRVVTLPDATTTLVGRNTTDTLTNKTLTSPVVSGGTIDNATVGATTATTGAFTTLTSTGGAVNGTIGATTPAAGTFTTITGQTEVLKGTGQNLLLQSQTFTNASWTKDGATATASGVTAPDSTSTGQTLTESATTAEHRMYQSIVLPVGNTYTWSIYAKPNGRNWIRIGGSGGTRSANFNVSTGVVGTVSSNTTATITNAGNGWYRCTMTGAASATPEYMVINLADADAGTGSSYVYTGNGTSGAFFWGSQIEVGNLISPYTATTTAQIYGTPTLSFSGVAGLGLQSDGSLYASSAGTGNIRFYTNNVALEQMRVSSTASAVDYLQVTGATTASKVVAISAQGSDTDVTLSLAPKGAGTIRFGTYTAGILTAAGYITITDSGGTSRRLLVG